AEAQKAAPQDLAVAMLVGELVSQARRGAADAAARATAAGAPQLARRQMAAATKRRAAAETMAGSRPLEAARALRQSATLFDAAAGDAAAEARRREAALAEQRRQAAEQAARAQARSAPQPTVAAPPPPPAEAARPPEPRPSERSAPAEDEGTGVRDAIARYQRASESLDAAAVQAVWPNVDVAGLRRGFANAESLHMTVSGCEVKVQGDAATAVCQRQQRMQPKVGRALSSSQKVRFRLHRGGGTSWLIDGIDAL
ncbi:MAG TPA: hypothetical protein VGV61_06750, partial [Thermoanaerobaculia bacterium]|nr:hypothetical protein [Thermoanaerobaculia bacterium]